MYIPADSASLYLLVCLRRACRVGRATANSGFLYRLNILIADDLYQCTSSLASAADAADISNLACQFEIVISAYDSRSSSYGIISRRSHTTYLSDPRIPFPLAPCNPICND